MKGLKYMLSGLALVSLTVLFMFLPNLYRCYPGRENAQMDTRNISLAQTEQKLTPEETIRLLYDNAGNSIFTEAASPKQESEYAADCSEIVQEVFGREGESVIAKILLSMLQNYTQYTVRTSQCITLYGDQVMSLNIVMAQFDDLCISYEESSGVALNIMVYNAEGYVASSSYMANEFTYELENDPAFMKYYSSLGMKEGEYEGLAYNSPSGWKLSVGIIGMPEYEKAMDILTEQG